MMNRKKRKITAIKWRRKSILAVIKYRKKTQTWTMIHQVQKTYFCYNFKIFIKTLLRKIQAIKMKVKMKKIMEKVNLLAT
jgi:hypothetical protein